MNVPARLFALLVIVFSLVQSPTAAFAETAGGTVTLKTIVVSGNDVTFNFKVDDAPVEDMFGVGHGDITIANGCLNPDGSTHYGSNNRITQSGDSNVSVTLDSSRMGSEWYWHWQTKEDFKEPQIGGPFYVNDSRLDFTCGVANTTSFTVTVDGGVTPPPPADTTSPTAPSSVALASRTTSSLTASWGASTDNVGVTGYRVYLNGAFKLSTGASTRSATLSGLAYATSYTVAVRAVDAAGNVGAAASLTATTSKATPTVKTYVSNGRIYGSASNCGQKVVLQKWSSTYSKWVTKKTSAATTAIRCSGSKKVYVTKSKGKWRTLSYANVYVNQKVSTTLTIR